MNIKNSFLLLLVFFTLPITANANRLNMKEAEIHYNAASEFEYKGDYQSAKEQYAKALVNAKLGGGEPALISMLTYNYGRMLGLTCQYEESEKNLLEALNIEKSVSGSDSGTISMRLFELARLDHDNNKYEKSIPYFEEGIPIVEKLGIERSDPIGYSLILEIYKDSLSQLNQSDKVNQIQMKIDKLKSDNPGKTPGYEPISYKCN